MSSSLATVTVLVRAGSKNECLETSGVSQFIKQLVLKGTATQTREQIQTKLNELGNNFNVVVGRETTTYTIATPKANVKKAIHFLGDILSNSKFEAAQIEAEREFVANLSQANQADQCQVTLESVHYTSYRDHFMGQPTNGIRENVGNITQETIKEFMENNYTAQNTVVAVAGNVSHAEVAEACSAFRMSESSAVQKNNDKPYFTPSTLFMRDDEMVNANFGVFFNAPSWKDNEFFAMHFLETLMGEYRADKYTGAHLNHPSRQYSLMHDHLGTHPDITLHKTFYFPYQDTALFGSYLFGNEVFCQQMMFLSQFILTEYSQFIDEHEMFRTRNKMFNDLLNQEDGKKLSSEMAHQVSYLGRRIPRSEFATRISNIEKNYLQRVVLDKFFDSDLSLVAWGPIHQVIAYSHYNRPLKRSTLGWYGCAQYQVY